jgi:hypothetical protein
MDELEKIAAHTQRFNEAVRVVTPPSPARRAKVMPMKDGIIELRQKGASLRLIRKLLATVGVAVGTETIARSLAEVNGEQALLRSSRLSKRRRVAVAAMHTRSPMASMPSPPPPQLPSSNSVRPADADKPPERSCTRGPRIPDPRNR